MWNQYRFEHNEDKKLFYCSDTHFQHAKLVEKRGFKTIDEHDQTIIENWNNTVRLQDTVIHCGDFLVGAGENSFVAAESFLRLLNGNIILIWGNHNAGIKTIYKNLLIRNCIPSKFNEIYPLGYDNDRIKFVGHYLLGKVKTNRGYQFVFCSHYAHRIWIDNNHLIPNICGHAHGSDIESNPDFPDHKRLDVGWENFQRPVSHDEVMKIMSKKNYIEVDHHNPNIHPSF